MLEQLVKSYTFDLLNFMVGLGTLLLPTLGLLWRMWRKQHHADELVVQQGRRIEDMASRHAAERKKQRDAIARLEARLAAIDPERFIDALDLMEAKHDLSGAEALAEEFTERQTEAFGRAAALLAERELFAADTEDAASEAIRFATIGLAADPQNAALAEIRSTATARQEAARNGEPMESIAMEGLSDVELNSLAHHLRAQGKYHHALAAARRCLPLALARTGKKSGNYAGALGMYASCRSDLGDHAAAEALYRETLEIDRAIVGEEHPSYAISLNNLARVVHAQGRATEAEAFFREAMEIDRATIGKAHPDYATGLNNLAHAVEAQGRASEAEALFREALEIDRATIGEAHPDYATDLSNLARLLRDEGRTEEARPLWEQALAILEATLPPGHPDIAAVRQALANLP